ncbi:MAG: hypothetical protein KF866_01940 [Phycisphaeraceae bacterium]|nr:hypothetical protein [Phycisphaeraceae bacterium]MCW5753546.1 hypothetical protein [Phycisphaeraceae bacterium]
MRVIWNRAAAWLVGVSGLGVGMALAGPGPGFSRVIEHDEGLRTTLEMVVRAYQPVHGSGPTIYLAAAVHIGDETFYTHLQTILNGLDVVLYEGVQPPGQGRDRRWGIEKDDAFRAKVTQARAHFLGVFLEEFRNHHGRYPTSLVELHEGIPQEQRALLEPALFDAWGRNFSVSVVEPQLAERRRRGGRDVQSAERPIAYVVSLGADGMLGGEGSAADIFASPAFPPSAFDAGERAQGIQQRLADALHLEFQLVRMDHSLPNWRNSDVGVDEIQRSLSEMGAEGQGEMLFDALGGQGLTGGIARLLVGIVGRSTSMRESTKAMLVDVLARADELLPAQEQMLGPLMEIILDHRNDVVVADLKRVLEDERGVRSIGIIYGAGHLPGIERALIEDLGYAPAGQRWVPAITADLGKAGMNVRQAKRIRESLRRQIDAQLQRGQR